MQQAAWAWFDTQTNFRRVKRRLECARSQGIRWLHIQKTALNICAQQSDWLILVRLWENSNRKWCSWLYDSQMGKPWRIDAAQTNIHAFSWKADSGSRAKRLVLWVRSRASRWWEERETGGNYESCKSLVRSWTFQWSQKHRQVATMRRNKALSLVCVASQLALEVLHVYVGHNGLRNWTLRVGAFHSGMQTSRIKRLQFGIMEALGRRSLVFWTVCIFLSIDCQIALLSFSSEEWKHVRRYRSLAWASSRFTPQTQIFRRQIVLGWIRLSWLKASSGRTHCWS